MSQIFPKIFQLSPYFFCLFVNISKLQTLKEETRVKDMLFREGNISKLQTLKEETRVKDMLFREGNTKVFLPLEEI